MAKVIYLKVDVDTYLGMKRGVLHLLNLFREFRIKATFFLSFGPDKSGRAIFNIWRQKGFLKKMLRTRAPALYGFRTMLYGTLIPAPMIAVRFPDIVRRIEDEGHEVGVHAWDHRLWQDHLDDLSPQRIQSEFERAFEAYESILGHLPRSTAAPAWYCNEASLSIQDVLGLDYCSDTRGESPFLPLIEGKKIKTLQIPTTMTCLEEIIGRRGDLILADYLKSELREDEPNVFPVHAEVEGNLYRTLFRTRLRDTLDEGVEYLPLRELYKSVHESHIRRCPIIYKSIPGRSGVVAAQKTESLN
jgi:peptidoglycan/xylan/chitin deacetylase (PgdA/CDA1 family)